MKIFRFLALLIPVLFVVWHVTISKEFFGQILFFIGYGIFLAPAVIPVMKLMKAHKARFGGYFIGSYLR